MASARIVMCLLVISSIMSLSPNLSPNPLMLRYFILIFVGNMLRSKSMDTELSRLVELVIIKSDAELLQLVYHTGLVERRHEP